MPSLRSQAVVRAAGWLAIAFCCILLFYFACQAAYAAVIAGSPAKHQYGGIVAFGFLLLLQFSSSILGRDGTQLRSGSRITDWVSIVICLGGMLTVIRPIVQAFQLYNYGDKRLAYAVFRAYSPFLAGFALILVVSIVKRIASFITTKEIKKAQSN